MDGIMRIGLSGWAVVPVRPGLHYPVTSRPAPRAETETRGPGGPGGGRWAPRSCNVLSTKRFPIDIQEIMAWYLAAEAYTAEADGYHGTC